MTEQTTANPSTAPTDNRGCDPTEVATLVVGRVAIPRHLRRDRLSVVRSEQTAGSRFVRACKTCAERSRSILLEVGILILGLTLIFPSGVPVCLPPTVSHSSGTVWCENAGVMNPIPFWISMLVMDALLVWMGWNDFRTQRVPNLITYPLMAVGIVRVVVFRDPTFLVYWLVLGFFWMARFMGGGDAKFLMALFGLFPDLRLIWIMTASILATGVPYLVWKYRGRWRASLRRMVWRLVTRQLLPSQEEFEQEAVPYAFSISLAGVVYLFLQGGVVG